MFLFFILQISERCGLVFPKHMVYTVTLCFHRPSFKTSVCIVTLSYIGMVWVFVGYIFCLLTWYTFIEKYYYVRHEVFMVTKSDKIFLGNHLCKFSWWCNVPCRLFHYIISFMSTNTTAGKHNLMHVKAQSKIMLHKQHKRVFWWHRLVDSQKILRKLHF